MDIAARGAQGIAGIVWVICFIVILLAMFKNGKSGLALVCIIASLCFGVGSIIAFVVGWMRSTEWNLRTCMIIMTIALLIGLIGTGGSFATH